MKPTVISINKVDDLSRDPLNIYNDTFLLGYRGSLAHNMYVPGTDPNSIDDVDLMGFSFGDPKHYLGLTEWGSRGTKEFWHYEYDCVFYEAKKAISLLLQGNPNIMSMLWLRNSDYLYRSPEGYSLLNNKQMFVGKHVYHSFAGYASAQLLKMETREPAQIREYLGVTYEMKRRGIHPTDQSLPDDVADATDCSSWGDEVLRARWSHYSKKGENMGYMGDKRKKLVLKLGYDSKNSAHCIRLLRMAKEFLSTGEMIVHRLNDAQELLDIKRGTWELKHLKEYAEQLFAEAKEAYLKSPLPPEPDRAKAESWLIESIPSYFSRVGLLKTT